MGRYFNSLFLEHLAGYTLSFLLSYTTPNKLDAQEHLPLDPLSPNRPRPRARTSLPSSAFYPPGRAWARPRQQKSYVAYITADLVHVAAAKQPDKARLGMLLCIVHL